eukprot:15325868-Alexandrium_andersonii.AAC.1
MACSWWSALTAAPRGRTSQSPWTRAGSSSPRPARSCTSASRRATSWAWPTAARSRAPPTSR